MKPGNSPDTDEVAARVARWAGWPLTKDQLSQLRELASWLEAEAIPAGVLGAGERNRIWRRHIADSLTFAVGWESAPTTLVDVGTGAGLPGVPLAILWPDCEVRLLDRSLRTTDLLDRLLRMLELPNAAAERAEAGRLAACGALVMRAAFPAAQAVRFAATHLLPGGRAVLGWRRGADLQPEEIVGRKADLSFRRVPIRILDEGPVLLIMTARG